MEVIMENLLPFLLILIFFGLGFWGEKWLQTRFAIVLSCAVMLFFLIMALVDSEHKFPYLLFAILAAGLAWRKAKSSGLLGKLNTKNSHH
jgi:4-amino-4-deoxy-L-arabinose transferase-like glycosyltransferase